MKKLLWFLIGVIGGFVAAHFMNKDPRGHDMLAELDARISGFTSALSDAYRAEEARLASTDPTQLNPSQTKPPQTDAV